MTAHPRIVIPIVAVLAGGLSYAIFDPIRAFFVKAKASHMFDLERYRLTKWLKRETIARLGDLSISSTGLSGGLVHRKKSSTTDQGDHEEDDGEESKFEQIGTGIELERIEAAEKLKLWLNEMPDTFVTITCVYLLRDQSKQHQTDASFSQRSAWIWQSRLGESSDQQIQVSSHVHSMSRT